MQLTFVEPKSGKDQKGSPPFAMTLGRARRSWDGALAIEGTRLTL